LEVELRRPEITKCEWKDNEGDSIDKNVLGELAVLSAETKDLEDGKTVTFKIYRDGADTRVDKPVKILDVAVEGDKAETGFNFTELQMKPAIDEAMYRYYQDQGYGIPREEFEYYLDDYEKEIESDITEKPKYFYTAEAWKCKEAKSETIEVSKTLRITVLDAVGNPVKDVDIKLKEVDGTEHNETTNEEGYIELSGMVPAEDYIDIIEKEPKHG
jgi:hypothetical protein